MSCRSGLTLPGRSSTDLVVERYVARCDGRSPRLHSRQRRDGGVPTAGSDVQVLDPWTRHYLGALGVGPGWQYLEVGSGNGSVAEWLCDVVGSSGSVTAVDINTVLLDLVPAQNLRVSQWTSHRRTVRERLRPGQLPCFPAPVAGDAAAVLEKWPRP